MSNSPASPRKQNNITKYKLKTYKEDNNNATNKFTERQQARTFIAWYKHMIDHERQNFGLYLSDDAILEWFGRTVKTRKKVQSFLRYDMQCSRHDFTTVESINKVQLRHEKITNKRKDDTVLANPLHSPELISSKSSAKKRLLRSNCNSPEWAEGCQPDDKSMERKRLKSRRIQSLHDDQHNSLKRVHPDSDVSSKGDGIAERRPKQKCVAVTPPNHELGQGDCLPSTSSNTASHEALNAQLPKLAVECNGYIEFTRTRNNRSTDCMKWERKCKVQISYSEDPLNVGEYIIWSLHYIDETKCRRNLMAAFEAAAQEEESNKIK